jgi:hypothetical protein
MHLKKKMIAGAVAGSLSVVAAQSFATTTADAKAALLAASAATATSVSDNPIVTEIISDNGTQSTFLIQDAAGGIDVFRNADATYTPAVGDAISIGANIVSFHGLFELEAPFTTVTKVSSGNALPAQDVFTIANTENGSTTGVAMQSELGTLSNVTFNSEPGDTAGTTFASNGTYSVTDGVTSGFTTIFVPSTATALIGQTIPTGPVNISGYFGQFDSTITSSAAGSGASSANGFELDPLTITATPEPASLGLLGIGGLMIARRRRRM